MKSTYQFKHGKYMIRTGCGIRKFDSFFAAKGYIDSGVSIRINYPIGCRAAYGTFTGHCMRGSNANE